MPYHIVNANARPWRTECGLDARSPDVAIANPADIAFNPDMCQTCLHRSPLTNDVLRAVTPTNPGGRPEPSANI